PTAASRAPCRIARTRIPTIRFLPSMATRNSDYSEASIRVLKGLEPVRQRPGMYTRTESPLHIVQEASDNAADEALAGFCREIALTLHADGSVTADADVRGIPV